MFFPLASALEVGQHGATPPTPDDEEPVRFQEKGRGDLHWTGTLEESDLRRLDDEFGDVIVCPGYTGKVGSAADAQGRLYLLGAVKGYKRTRGVFNAWQSKSVNDEKYNWWAAETKKRSIKPIAIRDMIHGVTKDRWSCYNKLYRAAVAHRIYLRNKLKRINRAIELKQS